MAELGEPTYRARQLAQWLWQRGVASYEEMTNLSHELRERLAEAAPLRRAHVEAVQVSADGTRKYLLAFADGVRVETVGLPEVDADADGASRLTVCLSAQAGCTLGCVFCATGRGGFVRDLLPGEIAEQVRVVGADFGQRVTNVVVMGQGEPFLNYDAVLAGLRLINSPAGLGIGGRHITVSTAGILRGIERFASEPEQFVLAVSLHSAIQETRDRLMPGLRGQNLVRLQAALERYVAVSGRRPSLEYTLIAGVNDTPKEAAALVAFARRLRAHVNMLSLNVGGSGEELAGSDENVARRFAARVRQGGVEVSMRVRRGVDIDAACGQLRAR